MAAAQGFAGLRGFLPSPSPFCLPLEGKVAAEGGRMRCRPAGRVPLSWMIIQLISSQQLALFSARSARAKGSGDPAPVPLILWTPYPLPAPGLRARTRGRHICIRKRDIYKQVGAPSDAPFLCAGIVWYLCRGGACPARCTQSTFATPPKHKTSLLPL